MRHLAWLALAPFLFACPKKADEVDAGTPVAGPAQLSEAEPNNRPEQALAIAQSAVVTAGLSADPSKPDEDWYLLDVPSPQSVDLQVSGIPGADVTIEVYDPDRNRLAAVNSEGEGKPERIPNLGVSGKTYVKVLSARKGAGGAYSLTATLQERAAGFEAEPNDRAVDANVLPLGETISGYVGHASDEDWYRFELPVAEGGAAPVAPEPGGAQAPVDPSVQPAPAPAPAPADGATVAQGDADAGSPAPIAAAAESPSVALRIELAAVDGLRFELSVLSAAEAPLYRISSKEGEGLSLRNIGVRQSDRLVYVVVKSAWVGTGKEARRPYSAEKPYQLTVTQEEAGANAELEPNDEPFKATPLAGDGFREGFLSPKTDVDYFVFRPAQPTLIKLNLSGVERLDHVLSVVAQGADGAPEQVLLRANDGTVKEPEILNNVYCERECFVKVESGLRKVDGKWVKDFENPEQPYRLSVQSVPDNGTEEREPNLAEAPTPLDLGRSIRGTIYPRKDSDFYRLDFSQRPVRTSINASVTGILKVDLGLYLHRLDETGKPSLVQTSDRAKGEAPEVIRHSLEPGVYLLEVRDSRKTPEANFQDAYQLTVVEGEG